mgnify:CR=1 FL=1
MTTNEKFLYHKPCKECGSRDNLGVYENHTYCFGCHKYTAGGDEPEGREKRESVERSKYQIAESIYTSLAGKK